MALTVTHSFISPIADDAEAAAANEVLSSHWNANHTITGARDILTANISYYVRTDGSDANSGTADTAGGAWLTLQHAMNVIASTVDFAGFTVTVNIGTGTFAGVGLKSCVGGGKLYFNGNGHLNTFLQGGPNDGVYNNGEVVGAYVTNSTTVYVNNLTIQPTAVGSFNNVTGFALVAADCDISISDPVSGVAGTLDIDNSIVGAGNVIYCQGTGSIFGLAPNVLNYKGNANTFMTLYSPLQGFIFPNTFNVNGTPAWGLVMVQINDLSWLQAFTTFVGAATGKRYEANNNGVIDTFGSGANFFPGNVAGTTSAGGQYV